MINYIKRLLKKFLIEKITNRNIVSGPFKGMKYVTTDALSIFFPYALGTQELELKPIVEKLCEEPFDTIVNVGAGQGYYAVGFAIRNHRANVIAFEANSKDRNFIVEIAEINGIKNRLEVKGLCDISLLSKSIGSSKMPLIIMDIEGVESILLDPVIIPKLQECHILVELHDFVFREIAEIISKWFRNSYEITEIWSRPRTIHDFPIKFSKIALLAFKKLFIELMNEKRPERMRWFYLKPHKMMHISL